jgi:hypothetical protein
MAATTPIYALPYPSPSDPADVPADMQALASRIEAAIGPGTVEGQALVWDNTLKIWKPSADKTAASARTYQGASQNVASGVATMIPFAGTRFDRVPAGMSPHWSSGQPTRLTCRVSGVYLVGCQSRIVTGSGGTMRQIAVVVSTGATAAITGWWNATSSAVRIYPSVTAIWYLNVGEYIELQAFQDSGTNVSWEVGSGETNSALWLAKIG